MNTPILSAVQPPEPPHAIEAEQALIGAVLMDNAALDALGNPLPPGAFYLPIHQRIWTAILASIERGHTANPVTLKRDFEADQALADVGGAQYLARLAAQAVTVISVEHYAGLIADMALRRALLDAGREIVTVAMDAPTTAPAADLLSAAERLIGEVQRPAERLGAQPIGHMIGSVVERASKPEATEPPLRTGIATLDEYVRLARGRYVVLGGRTSMGKSALALEMAMRAIRGGERRGERVGAAIFSLEMGAAEIGSRLLSSLTWSGDHRIPYEDIDAGRIDQAQAERLGRAGTYMLGLPYWIDERKGLTPAQVGMAARRLKRLMAREGAELRLIVVDHITKLRPDRERRGDSKVVEVGEISNALANLAGDLNVCVLACCQINRQTEGREDKRPTLADIRWSGDIEQDADVVALLYRGEYYLAKETVPTDPAKAEAHRQALEAARNKAELLVAKNRGGRTGKVELFCDIACNRFGDLELPG